MLVEFLKSMPASPDGLTVRTYHKGEQHNLPKDLGNNLVKAGYAIDVEQRVQKSLGSAPMNKMMNERDNKVEESQTQKKRRPGRPKKK